MICYSKGDLLGSQAYDADSSRLLSENTSIAAGLNRYTLGGNNPDQHRSGSSNLGVKSDNLGPSIWYDLQYYLNPANNWNDGNYAFAIVQYGAMAAAAVAGTAAIAIVGPAAVAGSVVSYASSVVGTSLATYGLGMVGAGSVAGAADATLAMVAMVATGQFDGLNLVASTVGGALNPVNGFGGLGSGLAGAYVEFATTGELSGKGYQIGSIAGGVVTGGVDDFVMSGRKFAAGGAKLAGGVTGAAAWHATKRVGVEGGFTVAGGAIGYANGGMDGLLLGAGIGQSVGGIVGNLAVACFTAKTPILISHDGSSKPVEEIREGDLLLARDEHDADGPLELKRVEEVFTRSSHVIELIVRGKIIGTTAEHPFYVVRLKRFIPAGNLEIGEAFLSHDGQMVTLEAVRDTGKIETVYNFRIADHHTYFVGGSEWGFSVWVHNASYPAADAALSQQGERFRSRAEELWATLPNSRRYGATVAVSNVDGREVVSLYANVGPGRRQFSQVQIDEFLKNVESTGGVAIHTSGRVHAEQALHQAFDNAPAIGISNPYGPCSNCTQYFQQQNYSNIWWPER